MSEVPNVYQATHKGSAPRFNKAFAVGCGGKIVIGPQLQPGPVALWGDPLLFEMLTRVIADGRTWYYGDHAFFGRSKQFRITKNSFYLKHWRGPDFDRLEKCQIEIEPTKTDGDFILLCPPTESLSKRNGFTQNHWLNIMRRRIAKYSNRRIVVRHKPKVHPAIPLRDALDGAWALVTYTSNAAVEAVCAGYPVFTTAACAAYPMARSDVRELESPLRWTVDERRIFAAILAANQWTLPEIAAGLAWENLSA